MAIVSKCPACGCIIDPIAHQAEAHATTSRMLGELAQVVRRYKEHNAQLAARLERSNVGGRR